MFESVRRRAFVQSIGALALVGILDFATGTNQFYPDVGLAVRDRIPAVMVGKFGGEDLLIPARTRWFHLLGLPVYQSITGPEYLLLADDTLDKIDRERFVTVNRTFIDLVERFQYIPRRRRAMHLATSSQHKRPAQALWMQTITNGLEE